MVMQADDLPEPIGGWLCLDFTNTAEARQDGRAGIEYLSRYARLLDWALDVNLLSLGDVDTLAQLAEQHPTEADLTYRRAIALREALYRTFSAVAAGSGAMVTDREAVEHAAVDALSHGHLGAQGDLLAWTWPAPSGADDLARPLWPIAHSAVDLLTSPALLRVKECPGGGEAPCSWLFVDLSKNSSRRWCRMGECGSIAKARRQTNRRRERRASARS